MKKYPAKKILTSSTFVILLFATLFVVDTKQAHAQAAGAGVPIGTSFDFNITMQHVKDYITDKLAYDAAGVLLQQITTSVVNWINSGFNGSPSFLTNPDAFFLDTADQITGAFISNTGALAELCSPWNIDIRLTLALGGLQSGPSKRYTCTLSSVINNAARSTVNVNAQTTLNGKVVQGVHASGNALGGSVDTFTGGDFSQGGWPAYLAMTTQTQNNIYGAYMTAKDDVQQQIANRQRSLHFDLQMGAGFLSSKKCTPVDITEYNSTNGEITTDGKGNTVYENCTVQTPGSVIGSALNKSLGIPQDRLNMADSINKIASALFSQLVTQVLSKGLATATHRSGGNTAGIVVQLQAQTEGATFDAQKQQLLKAIDAYNTSSGQQTTITNEQTAINSLNAPKTAYLNALSCFETLASTTPNAAAYAQSEIILIQNALATQITPLQTSYQDKLTQLISGGNQIAVLKANVQAAMNADQIQQYTQQFNQLSGSNIGVVTGINDSTTDIASAKKTASGLLVDAQNYQSSCTNYYSGTRVAR